MESQNQISYFNGRIVYRCIVHTIAKMFNQKVQGFDFVINYNKVGG